MLLAVLASCCPPVFLNYVLDGSLPPNLDGTGLFSAQPLLMLVLLLQLEPVGKYGISAALEIFQVCTRLLNAWLG